MTSELQQAGGQRISSWLNLAAPVLCNLCQVHKFQTSPSTNRGSTVFCRKGHVGRSLVELKKRR